MAKLAEYFVLFDAPTGENTKDTVEFRAYVVKDGEAFNYSLPYISIPATAPGDTHEFDMAELIVEDGVYDAYITSVDTKGNISDPAALENTTVDRTAPAKPVNLRLR